MLYTYIHLSYFTDKCAFINDDTAKRINNESTIDKNVEIERNPAYVPIEMNQIEDKPTYVT